MGTYMANFPKRLVINCKSRRIFPKNLYYAVRYCHFLRLEFNQNKNKIKMSELSREIGDIWTRLFDHRPFLNGEISFMLREFEEKRGDRDVESLFSMLENFTDVRDTHIERLAKTGGLVLSLLLKKIEQTRELAAEAEKSCIDLDEVYKQKQAENREKRRKEWDHFIDDMNFNCQRIDNTFEEKEEELRDLYTDLNHKLNINSSK